MVMPAMPAPTIQTSFFQDSSKLDFTGIDEHWNKAEYLSGSVGSLRVVGSNVGINGGVTQNLPRSNCRLLHMAQ